MVPLYASGSMDDDVRLTNMRIPSASFCQRSVILSSSFSAISEYMMKRGPELSPKLNPPSSRCEGRSNAGGGWSRWLSTTCFCECGDKSLRELIHTRVNSLLEMLVTSPGHFVIRRKTETKMERGPRPSEPAHQYSGPDSFKRTGWPPSHESYYVAEEGAP
jgi:hypothetical protein